MENAVLFGAAATWEKLVAGIDRTNTNFKSRLLHGLSFIQFPSFWQVSDRRN
jgi:hypothetical protein